VQTRQHYICWRIRLKLIVVPLLGVLAAACSGPDATPAPKAPPVSTSGAFATTYTGHGPKVVILGDSLIVLEWKELYDGLDSRYSVEIGAWFGEGYNPGDFSVALGGPAIIPEVAKTDALSHPAIVVLALGTNDAWSRRSTSIALSTMATMVREFRGACLVGITLPEHSTVAGWSNTEAHTLNIAMRRWADQIVDWATMSARPGNLAADGIHTTHKGTRLRASAIISAIEHCTR
jgi:lysophospholipase L1-like esterase